MDRFKKHLARQVDRWIADKAELEEALIDIDAGRITGVSDDRRTALQEAIHGIANAITHLDAFIEERPKLRIARSSM